MRQVALSCPWIRWLSNDRVHEIDFVNLPVCFCNQRLWRPWSTLFMASSCSSTWLVSSWPLLRQLQTSSEADLTSARSEIHPLLFKHKPICAGFCNYVWKIYCTELSLVLLVSIYCIFKLGKYLINKTTKKYLWRTKGKCKWDSKLCHPQYYSTPDKAANVNPIPSKMCQMLIKNTCNQLTLTHMPWPSHVTMSLFIFSFCLFCSGLGYSKHIWRDRY